MWDIGVGTKVSPEYRYNLDCRYVAQSLIESLFRMEKQDVDYCTTASVVVKTEVDSSELFSKVENAEEPTGLAALLKQGDCKSEPSVDGEKTDAVKFSPALYRLPRRSLSCLVCGERFENHADFRIHLSTHSLLKPYLCNMCGMQFAQKGALMFHIRTHISDRPFLCVECGQRFVEKEQLNEHKRIHIEIKLQKCSVCNKNFNRKRDLEGHMRTHSGEKPYACSLCDKQFAQRGSLIAHLRSHTDEKFKCEKCGKQFGENKNLKKHALRCRNKALFECPMCKEQYFDLQKVKLHLKEHENEASAELSSMVQKQFSENLARNLRRSGSYECPICRIQFASIYHLNNHIREHGKKVAHIRGIPQDMPRNNDTKPVENVAPNIKDPAVLVHMQLLEKLKDNTHGRISLECPICKEPKRDLVDMNAHLKVHENDPIPANAIEKQTTTSNIPHEENVNSENRSVDSEEMANDFYIEPSSVLEVQLSEPIDIGDVGSYSLTSIEGNLGDTNVITHESDMGGILT
ncbi:hypothetical protein SK128_000745 [Halocaridina rubra]|uniref:C2H2-type domain-containing protein n=1 Tax=Halocaridina rubra TaxID=373956 RepID=A0AAN8WPT5_HALRR